MLRSIFFATGLFVGLWGVALLFIAEITLTDRAASGKPVDTAMEEAQESAESLMRSAQQQLPAGARDQADGAVRSVSQQRNMVPQQPQQRNDPYRGYYAADPRFAAQPAATRPVDEKKKAVKKKPRVIQPPDWAAFSLMSIGTVTMLYSIALPKRG